MLKFPLPAATGPLDASGPPHCGAVVTPLVIAGVVVIVVVVAALLTAAARSEGSIS